MTRVLASCCVAALVLGTVRCAPAANGSEPALAPGDALVVLDLSASLTMEQRLQSAAIAIAVIRREVAPNATFALYALESSMLDAKPLLSARVPDPVTTTQVIEASRQFAAWRSELEGGVKQVLESERRLKAMTSCYLKSAGFAAAYFKARPAAAKRTLAWVGDLIEDCREPDYNAFRLSRVGARPDAFPADRIKTLPSLQGTYMRAVIVPRQAGDRQREVDTEIISAYWRNLASHLGIAAGQLQIGTPSMLGFAEPKSRE